MTVCQEAKFGSKLDFGTIKISIISYVITLHSTYQERHDRKGIYLILPFDFI